MASNVVSMPEDDRSAARIENDELIIEEFHERDGHVVALAKESTDVEDLVHELLRVGSRALAAAQTSTDVAVVEKAFDDMTTAFNGDLERLGGELEKKAVEFFDSESGVLPRSLEE